MITQTEKRRILMYKKDMTIKEGTEKLYKLLDEI